MRGSRIGILAALAACMNIPIGNHADAAYAYADAAATPRLYSRNNFKTGHNTHRRSQPKRRMLTRRANNGRSFSARLRHH